MYKKIVLYDNQKVDYLVVLNKTANQNDINTANDVNFIPSWDAFSNTEIVAPLNEDLVSTYISGLTGNITGYTVYRQKMNEDVLRKVAETDRYNLSIIDYMVANNTEYQWTIVPITDDTFAMSLRTERFKTDWYSWSLTSINEISNNVYIADETWLFDLNISANEMEQNLSRTRHNTYSQFPKFSIGETNYISSGFSCLLGNLENATEEYVDNAEKHEAWRNFVSVGKPYILKDRKGNLFKVQIETSSSNYMDNTLDMPTTITITYSQTGSPDKFSVYNIVKE